MVRCPEVSYLLHLCGDVEGYPFPAIPLLLQILRPNLYYDEDSSPSVNGRSSGYTLLLQPMKLHRLSRRFGFLHSRWSERYFRLASTSGVNQELNKNGPKRKEFYRHTPHQIQEMELYFKECPLPPPKQREALARKLGLDPPQVKYWFQNKRTRLKNNAIPIENSESENANTSCSNRLGSPNEPRLESSKLNDQGFPGRSTLVPTTGCTTPISITTDGPLGFGSVPLTTLHGDIDLISLEEIRKSIMGQNSENIPFLVKIADDAMLELVRGSLDYTLEPIFPMSIPNGRKLESSVDLVDVNMCHLSVVEAFMNKEKWVSVFSNIVSRAMIHEQIIAGTEGTFDKTLQLVVAEYHTMTTPIIPTRKSVFLRYCKKQTEGMWTIVDVSVDYLLPATAKKVIKCRRRPSGCVINALPNGSTKLHCIEHMEVEVDDKPVHPLARHILNTCLVYGAGRWVAELERHCKRQVETSNPGEDPSEIGFGSLENIGNILRLSERMVRIFCEGMTDSTAYGWRIFSGDGDGDGDGVDKIRIITREAGNGKYVAASITFWLPVSPDLVFEYLRDERNRPTWDRLSRGGEVKEITHYTNAQEAGNVISILKIRNKESMDDYFILQETKTEQRSTYHIVYALVDEDSFTDLLMGEGEQDNVEIFPGGFSILPCKTPPNVAGTSNQDEATTTGTLLTVGFQVLMDSQQNADSAESVTFKTVTNMVDVTMRDVKRCLLRANDKAAAS